MSETITPAQLAAMLAAMRGSQPITISALTRACKLPDGREVFKLARVHSFNRADHGAAVNRAQQGEGHMPFVPAPRSWGRNVSQFLVSYDHPKHGLRYYLPLRVLRADKPVYFARDAAGFLRYVPRDMVTPHLPPERAKAPHGVVVRDYALDNLVSVHVRGKRLRVVAS